MSVSKGKKGMKEKVSVLTSSFARYDTAPIRLLEKKGFKIINNTFGRKVSKEETLRLCEGCVGIVAGTELYDKSVLSKLSGVKVISRCGAGTENIDLEIAKKLGIKVFSTPDAPTLAVAELTLGLILALLRKIPLTDREIRAGLWKKNMGNLLFGKQVGIVGFGRIGRKVAELLKPFACKICYTDPHVEDGLMGLKKMPLKKLLNRSDIIFLHVSGKEKILGRKELAWVKRKAWLVNVSRGGTVNENALCKALKENRLLGAAIDVFEKEPYQGPLGKCDNVILTAHIGSYAKEARINMEAKAVRNLLKGLRE